MNDLDFLMRQKKINSQLLSKLKDGDWVRGELGTPSIHNPEPKLVQMWQVENIKDVPDFPRKFVEYGIMNGIVYTNKRMFEEWAHKPMINPLGIVEIVPEQLVENYVEQYNMFKSTEFVKGEEYMINS